MSAAILSYAWALIAIIYLVADAPQQWLFFALSACLFFTGVSIIVAELKKARR